MTEWISDYLRSHKDIVETDASAFDATVGWQLRSLEKRVYVSFFGAAVVKYLDSEITSTVATPNGNRYRPGNSRLSGSPLTTDGNTIMLAFVSYLAHRLVGLSPPDAYASIGPKYGDDSIDSGGFDMHNAAAKILGLSFKNETVEGYVGFLGRKVYFTQNDALYSVPDFPRVLRKLHLVTARDNTLNRASNKVAGLLSSDPNTGFYSCFLRKIATFLPPVSNPTLPFIQGPWTTDDGTASIMLEAQFGVDCRNFVSSLDTAKSLDDIRRLTAKLLPCELINTGAFIYDGRSGAEINSQNVL
jgi:hypothetical protein